LFLPSSFFSQVFINVFFLSFSLFLSSGLSWWGSSWASSPESAATWWRWRGQLPEEASAGGVPHSGRKYFKVSFKWICDEIKSLFFILRETG